ncbi:hypothetical protein ACP8Y2_06325 [Herpetosiphon llansteffanensis]
MQHDFEALLCRLIANPTSYQLFGLQPESLLHQYALSSSEQAQIQLAYPDLADIHQQFTARRQRRMRRPLARTIDLLGELGEQLLKRYLDLYPAPLDASNDLLHLSAFLTESLQVHTDLPQAKLIAAVLDAETAIYRALRTPSDYEAVADYQTPQITASSVLRCDRTVNFATYAYPLTTILQQQAADLAKLAPQPTHLIIYRRQGQRDIQLMQVNAAVIQALKYVDGLRSIGQIAEALSSDPASLQRTHDGLVQLFQRLAQALILVV